MEKKLSQSTDHVQKKDKLRISTATWKMIENLEKNEEENERDKTALEAIITLETQ